MEFFRKTHDISQIYDEASDNESLFHVQASPNQKITNKISCFQKRLIPRYNCWNRVENQRYIQFLREYFGLFQRSGRLRAQSKIYYLMSEYIKSKNYAQCRIHHFHMLQRHGTTENIIESTRRNSRRGAPRSRKISDYAGLRVCIEEEELPKHQETQDLWSMIEDGVFDKNGQEQELS